MNAKRKLSAGIRSYLRWWPAEARPLLELRQIKSSWRHQHAVVIYHAPSPDYYRKRTTVRARVKV